MTRWCGPVLLVLLAACGPPSPPRYPDMMNRDLYTCCNLYFDLGRYASDANYDYRTYREAITVPAGTRVRVLDGDAEEIRFEPQGMRDPFRLGFKFGKGRMPSEQWFRQILVDDDPRAALGRVPADVARAIGAGELVVGMTKRQAIMARGYPPLHRTAGVESDEWRYYVSPGLVDHVAFADGRITSIQRESAPK